MIFDDTNNRRTIQAEGVTPMSDGHEYRRGRLIINAANVHQGGGGMLLAAILSAIPDGASVILCVDSRFAVPDVTAESSSIQVRTITASMVNRVKNERWLSKTVGDDDVVLCFGNLPPIFKLRGHTCVFIQNRYLVEKVGLNDFPIRVRIRISLERLWLSATLDHVDEFVVQTPTMAGLASNFVKRRVPVRISPFVRDTTKYTRTNHSVIERTASFDFIYVASGEAHKNHVNLIEAWCVLAKEGLFPSLKLTLDARKFGELCFWIEKKSTEHRLCIENVGSVSTEQISVLYSQARALVYPSTLESFGLPLIEAAQAGLPVLAAELDFVRDLVDPVEAFDARSPVSIARAVKRFLGRAEEALPLRSAREFLNSVLDKAG
jgi:glycosyltransferase involved in cell wall biosynthesis